MQYATECFNTETGANAPTQRQFTVLSAIEANEGCTQTDLVRLTSIDRSTLADMISRLVHKGMVARVRTDADARANAVSITAAGRKALRASQNAARRAEAKIVEPLPASKRAEFLRLLGMIAAAANGDAAPAAPKRRAARRR